MTHSGHRRCKEAAANDRVRTPRNASSARRHSRSQFGKTPLPALSTSRGNGVRGSAWTAILTRSATDLTRNFRVAVNLYRIRSTPKSAAICLFKAPSATRPTISRSRALSELRLSRKAEFASSSARRAYPSLGQLPQHLTNPVRGMAWSESPRLPLSSHARPWGCSHAL